MIPDIPIIEFFFWCLMLLLDRLHNCLKHLKSPGKTIKNIGQQQKFAGNTVGVVIRITYTKPAGNRVCESGCRRLNQSWPGTTCPPTSPPNHAASQTLSITEQGSDFQSPPHRQNLNWELHTTLREGTIMLKLGHRRGKGGGQTSHHPWEPRTIAMTPRSWNICSRHNRLHPSFPNHLRLAHNSPRPEFFTRQGSSKWAGLGTPPKFRIWGEVLVKKIDFSKIQTYSIFGSVCQTNVPLETLYHPPIHRFGRRHAYSSSLFLGGIIFWTVFLPRDRFFKISRQSL